MDHSVDRQKGHSLRSSTRPAVSSEPTVSRAAAQALEDAQSRISRLEEENGQVSLQNRSLQAEVTRSNRVINAGAGAIKKEGYIDVAVAGILTTFDAVSKFAKSKGEEGKPRLDQAKRDAVRDLEKYETISPGNLRIQEALEQVKRS